MRSIRVLAKEVEKLSPADAEEKHWKRVSSLFVECADAIPRVVSRLDAAIQVLNTTKCPLHKEFRADCRFCVSVSVTRDLSRTLASLLDQ